MKLIRTIIPFLLLTFGAVLAHQSLEVGDGAYRLSVGFMVEPAFTGVINGLDLTVRDADGELVPNLEGTLRAWVLGPGGTELLLELSAVYGQPGSYKASFIPTAVGDYSFRVAGFIGATEVDLQFDDAGHYSPVVRDASLISIP